MSERRRRRGLARLVVLAVALAAAGGGVAILERRRAAGPPIDPALVVKVARGDLEVEVIETGKVQPREKVEVKSKVAGQVRAVHVDEGQAVKKGQLLLELDPTDYERDVARSEADRMAAKNALDFAVTTRDRRRAGLATRAVAQIDVELSESEVRAKQAALRLAEVALAAAEDRLRYTRLVAPIAGTVIERGIQPGEVVTPGVQATFEGKPLLMIADLSTLLVRTELNQIDVAKVALGQRATLSLDALPGRAFEGRVTRVAPASQLPKGKDVDVFPVEVSLSRADPAIKPGMTADVRVHVDTRKAALTLPIEAVTREAGKSFATRVLRDAAGDRTERVPVVTGAKNDREVEIASGLTAGDEVLIKPASSSENEFK